MSITDKIAEICIKYGADENASDDVAKAILAALPDMIPDLVWEEFDFATAWAHSVFGTYRLDGVLLSLSTQKNYIGDGMGNHTFNNLEAAKAAANAHHKAQLAKAMGWTT